MSVSASLQGAKAAKQIFRLPPLPTIGDILRIYRLRALKHLSQNFLLDFKLTNKIVKAAGDLEGSCVLEVGPGPGSLTRSILNAGVREVTVIERDPRFFPVLTELKEACPSIPFNLIHDDILKCDLQGIFPADTIREWTSDELPPCHIIANLPFNISTPLIIRLLENISTRTGIFRYGRVRMTLMFQHEVAQRMIATPSNQQRCRLSVMCQNYCDVEYAFPIRGTSFVPKPDVNAGVVHLTPKKEAIIKQPFKMVEKVVRNIFNQRKKRVGKPLGLLFPESHSKLVGIVLEKAKISELQRPYLLTVEEFGEIVKAYEEVCEWYPELRAYQYR